METIYESTRLRDVYNTRWWNPNLQAFFIHYNAGKKPLRAGSQVFYDYGNRSDDFLVEQYGFCFEPGTNPFSAWKFRVNVGVSPTGEIEEIDELLPTESMYTEENYPNIDNVTETIALHSHRISEKFFEYMRSTMTYHYQELSGQDSEYLMISCPRVIPFEELIIDWAIKLMDKVAKDELFKRKSIEQDKAEIAGLGNDENSQKLRAIL